MSSNRINLKHFHSTLMLATSLFLSGDLNKCLMTLNTIFKGDLERHEMRLLHGLMAATAQRGLGGGESGFDPKKILKCAKDLYGLAFFDLAGELAGREVTNVQDIFDWLRWNDVIAMDFDDATKALAKAEKGDAMVAYLEWKLKWRMKDMFYWVVGVDQVVSDEEEGEEHEAGGGEQGGQARAAGGGEQGGEAHPEGSGEQGEGGHAEGSGEQKERNAEGTGEQGGEGPAKGSGGVNDLARNLDMLGIMESWYTV